MASDIPPVFLQEHAIETGLGGIVAIALRAPLLAGPTAPGGGDDPHCEIYIPVAKGMQVELGDGTPVELPSGAIVRVGIGRIGLRELTALAGQYGGYLMNATPLVL